jgi:hypothetical protein
VVDGSSSGLSDSFSLLLSIVHILDSMVVSWCQRLSSQKATIRLDSLVILHFLVPENFPILDVAVSAPQNQTEVYQQVGPSLHLHR